jgi:hypothetical protein
MERFGFKDIAVLPDFMSHQNGAGFELAGCVISRLSREDLNAYIEKNLILDPSPSAVE